MENDTKFLDSESSLSSVAIGLVIIKTQTLTLDIILATRTKSFQSLAFSVFEIIYLSVPTLALVVFGSQHVSRKSLI